MKLHLTAAAEVVKVPGPFVVQLADAGDALASAHAARMMHHFDRRMPSL
jgi:hypothetical protein